MPISARDGGRRVAGLNKGLILQERWLAANYHGQSLEESRGLLDKCSDVLAKAPVGSMKWCHALFTGLSLISGRSQQRLMALTFSDAPEVDEWWEVSGTEIVLQYRPRIVRNNLEEILNDEEYRSLVERTKTVSFPLPIPTRLAKPLIDWKRLGPARKKEVQKSAGKVIKDLQEYDLRPFTAGRIGSALSYFLATQKCGVATIGYLTGLSPRRCVALHYSQLKISETLPPYLEFLRALGIPDEEVPNVRDGMVGTALAMDDSALSWLYRQCTKPLQISLANDLRSYLHLHNEIAYMAWLYLQLSTGHRHNVGAMKSILHFEPGSGVLVIEDKTMRPHILSKSAEQQLEFFCNYLRNFKQAAASSDPRLEQVIAASLNGDEPLFFLLDSNRKRKPFSVRNLSALVQAYWHLPENWARHFSLTTLVTKLPADQFPAWAGHLEGEKEADDRFSCLTPSLQRGASDAMEEILNRLGIHPVNPCERELPDAKTTSSADSQKKLKAWARAERSRLRRDQDFNERTNTKVFWDPARLQKSAILWTWEAKFTNCLGRLSIGGSNREEWTALTIYSAMTRGGLTKPGMVFAFYNQLRRGGIDWWTVGDRCYVNLSHRVESGPFNLRVKEDRAFRQMQWPIDIQTLTLVLAGPFHSNAGQRSTPVGEGEFISWLSSWFTSEPEKGFRSLRELCKSVPIIYWFSLKAEISYAQAHITGPTQQNFTPNQASLISLQRAPRRIVWSKYRSRDLDIKSRRQAKRKTAGQSKVGRLSSEFGDAATDWLLDLLNDKTKRPAAIRELQNWTIQSQGTWSLESRMLVQWLEYKLGHIKVSTARRYAAKIGTEWFTAVQGRSFEDLDADGILNVYQRIYNATNNPKRRESYIQSLRWLHQFGMEEYGWPINDELAEFLRTRASLSYVGTSLVDYRHVNNTLEALDRLEVDEISRAQLKLILIIGFRCGMRIGEILKLRFRDVDAGSDWAIYVRGSRLGSNKSDNSLRKLEFSELASEEELSLLKQYYQELAVDRGSSDYFFGLGGENIPLDQVKCSQQIGGALRQSTGNGEVVFHSLRHSWASNTLAIIDEEWGLAESLSGFGRERLVSIRRYWLRSDDLVRDGLWQLAKALGHSTPATSAQTYLHIVPEMVYLKLARAVWQTPSAQKSLKNLLNIRQGELDTMGYDLVMARLVKQVRKRNGEQRIPAQQGRRHRPNLTFDMPATFLILANALKRAERGVSLSSIADQYPISEHDLNNIVNRCKLLAAMTTRTGARKLVGQQVEDKDQLGAGHRQVLLPSLHESPDVRRLAMDVANALRQRCLKKRARKIIIQQAISVLKAFAISKHYLLIKDRSDLASIVGFAQGLISEEYWCFKLKLLVKSKEENVTVKKQRALDYWSEVSAFVVERTAKDIEKGNKKSIHEHGVLYATLGHSGLFVEPDGMHRRHGVKMLAWLAYMTMAIYATNEELEAFTLQV